MDNSMNTINTGLGTIVTDTYDYVNNMFSNPAVITTLIIILLVYVLIFMSLGGSSNNIQSETGSSNTSIIGVVGVAFFVLLLLYNGLHYFFGYDLIASLKNLFVVSPELEVEVNKDASETRIDAVNAPVPEMLLRKQVFNIPGNEYGYEDAKALCSAYGSRLATYKEVEDAYNSGGEWCNYGWSEGQMALFPTQQSTYNELQKKEGHENDCGRPGVNGGYIANPRVKFGVNCYGYKPRMRPEEEDLMATRPLYPKTMKDIAMENRVKYWKDKLSEILVSPFNSNSWSKI